MIHLIEKRRFFFPGTAPAICLLLAAILFGQFLNSTASAATIANPQPRVAPPLTGLLRIQPDPLGRRLQSAFIWAQPLAPGDKPGVAVGFRKNFPLSKTPAAARLHLFADARYILWVNGTYVERGPARFQPNGPEYDSLEIAPYLHAGKNSLALLCIGNLSGGKVMRHPPGLAALLQIGSRTLWSTDESWQWTDSTRYRAVEASWPNLGETLVDATVEDGDWTQPDYDDSKWKHAAKIPGAQKVVIPNAGHASNMDQPELFNEAALRFLDSLNEPRA